MDKTHNKSKNVANKENEKDFSEIKKNKSDKGPIKATKQINNKNVGDAEKKTSEINDVNVNDFKLNEEVENLREEKLRLLAEMENLRKRSAKDKVDSIKYGNLNLARDMLTLGDNLSRALDVTSSEKNRSESFNKLIEGLKIVQKEFMTILEKHGVKKIESINKKFDHNYHQAMLEVETDEFNEGYVVQEIQSGFTLHDRLLRPSMVSVSKKPENKKKELKKA